MSQRAAAADDGPLVQPPGYGPPQPSQAYCRNRAGAGQSYLCTAVRIKRVVLCRARLPHRPETAAAKHARRPDMRPRDDAVPCDATVRVTRQQRRCGHSRVPLYRPRRPSYYLRTMLCNTQLSLGLQQGALVECRSL
jgi:hypothetical protein